MLLLLLLGRSRPLQPAEGLLLLLLLGARRCCPGGWCQAQPNHRL